MTVFVSTLIYALKHQMVWTDNDYWSTFYQEMSFNNVIFTWVCKKTYSINLRISIIILLWLLFYQNDISNNLNKLSLHSYLASFSDYMEFGKVFQNHWQEVWQDCKKIYKVHGIDEKLDFPWWTG